MTIPSAAERPFGPPLEVLQKIRQGFSRRDVQGLTAVFTLRGTAQRVDNAISEWMSGSVGSAARYQVLMALWASGGKGISHTEIVTAMGVTRATVSGLMAGLERDGLVKSCVDPVDRRKQIARLTQKSEAVIKKLHALNVAKFGAVFASFTLQELANLTELLHRFEQAFANPTEESVRLP
ncbi:MAG: MarR family transcriptional regulator [Candidatus Sulfotelmatobacter sp.]